ncbi:MAG TPA: hypothetical protein VMV10_02600 [Pirellulales bacterium]|nr:hypothetical protein [Pirellulales bacterium]HVA45496.1 hypothetical protein [Pirellulales bacterium]
MADAKDYIGKRGEFIVAEKLTDFCGRPLPFFDPHPLGEKCGVFDFLVELVTNDKTPPYFLVSAKATRKGRTKKSLDLKVGVKAKDVQAMVRCPVPAYLIGVDEPAGEAYIVSMHGNVKGPISSIPTAHPVNTETLAILWAEVRSYWKTLNYRSKNSKFQM